jgi:mono/diheme cytochrome c family protein
VKRSTSRTLLLVAAGAAYALAGVALAACDRPEAPAKPSRVERGRYLVRAMACNDCHTPWHLGPQGPEPDASRGLSGHPEAIGALPPAVLAENGPYAAAISQTNTAWSGPWGVSFTANLTPDLETGIGKWTEENFIQALRTGRHMGRGRPILPPMPYFAFRNLNDEDLASVFAYLMSQPAVRNRVPEPVPPAPASAPKPDAAR